LAVERRTRGQWISKTGTLLDFDCFMCSTMYYSFDEWIQDVACYSAQDIWRMDFKEFAGLTQLPQFYTIMHWADLAAKEEFEQLSVANYADPSYLNETVTEYNRKIDLFPKNLPFTVFSKFLRLYALNSWFDKMTLIQYVTEVDRVWQPISNMTLEIFVNHINTVANHHNHPELYNIYSLPIVDWLIWLEHVLSPAEYDHFISLIIRKSHLLHYEKVILDCKLEIVRTLDTAQNIREWLIYFIEQYPDSSK